MSYEELIEQRGGGPTIVGTRVTVYTVVEYLLGGLGREEIAQMLELSAIQVQAAIDFIEENDLEVMRDYIKILERIRRGNPPELQAKLDANYEKFLELLQHVKEAKARCGDEIKELIGQYRTARAEEHAHAGADGR